MPVNEHDAQCPLNPWHWLRHAVAAIETVMGGDPDESADRLAAASLVNGLSYYARSDEWETVTLKDVANYSTLMGKGQEERLAAFCTCGMR
jgi:hypothetical protein